MKKIIQKIKIGLYGLGIVIIFLMEMVFFTDCLNKKTDWFALILIILAFYSTCIMVNKILKSTDFLEFIRKTIYDKKLTDEEKIKVLEYEMFDIDVYLNDK